MSLQIISLRFSYHLPAPYYKKITMSKARYKVEKTDCGVKITACDGSPIIYDKILGYDSNYATLSDGNSTFQISQSDVKNALSPTWEGFWGECMALLKVLNNPTLEKELVEVKTAIDPSDPKKLIPLFIWRNPECVTDDIEGNNIVDINNYEMSNRASMPSEIKIEGIEKLDFVYCPDGGLTGGTLQDLLDAAIAEGALVNGVAPDAIAGYDLKALWSKTQLGTKVTTATGFTLGGDDDHYVNGGGVCQLAKPVDADCDGVADAAVATALQLDRPFEVVDGAGVQVCLEYYVADTDPTDPQVA